MGKIKIIKMKNIKIQNIYTILFFIASLLLVQSTNLQAETNGLEEKPLNVENLHSGLDISEDKTSFIEESAEATTEAKTEEAVEAKDEEAEFEVDPPEGAEVSFVEEHEEVTAEESEED